MKLGFIGSSLIIILITAGAAYAKSSFLWATVISVDDGDSFKVMIKGRKDAVRILGIDAPELNQPNGRQAGRALRSLLSGQRVGLRVTARDKYNRLLAYVQIQGHRVGPILVGAGLAWAMRKDLRPFEAMAKAAKLGLWAGRKPVRPSTWRRRHPRRSRSLDNGAR